MVKKTIAKWLAAGGAVLSVALMVGSVWAGTELIAPSSTSTARNGGAASVTGSTISMSGRAHPWVAQIYAPANRCLRLEVTSTSPLTDLGILLSAPNPSSHPAAPIRFAWVDDDGGGLSGGCLNCPLIKAAVLKSGWYTVTINHWQGGAFNSDFVLRYAHYPVGIATNCPTPTPALLAAPGTTSGGTKSQMAPDQDPQQQFEELDMK